MRGKLINQESLFACVRLEEMIDFSFIDKKAQRLRKRIERLIGEAKEQMGLRRARMRGKEKT